MERRRFTRVPFSSEAIVEGPGWRARGAIEDLSLMGLRIGPSGLGRGGEPVMVTVILSEPLELSFQLPGEVVRSDGRGLAVRFDLTSIDVGTLTHLRYLVGTELGDLDEVMREYSRWLDDQED